MAVSCHTGPLENSFFFNFPFLFKEQKINTEDCTMSSESTWVVLGPPRIEDTELLTAACKLKLGH
jgi:hypothetical protein